MTHEPPGVVIWRRSTQIKKEDTMATTDGEINVSTNAQAAIKTAIDALTPHKAEPRVAGLLGKLEGIASPEDFGDGEEQVVGAMLKMDALRKSEETLPEIRKHADDAFRALQLEHLGASNPRAAAAYEAARAA
jgi:hypothetical protein